MSKNRDGFRGYIGCRPIYGSRVAQHIQNLVIRDYTLKMGVMFKLSAVEYAMEDSFLILRRVLDELPSLEGIVLYSIFMLPEDRSSRQSIYEKVLGAGAELHTAVEGMILQTAADIEVWENVLITRQITSGIDYSETEKWLSSTS